MDERLIKYCLEDCGLFYAEDLKVANENVLSKVVSKFFDTISEAITKSKMSVEQLKYAKGVVSSKGDITKVPSYKDTLKVMEHLEILAKSAKGPYKKFLDDLRYIHDYTKKHKATFAKAFKEKCKEATSTYFALIVLWQVGISRLIVICTEDKKGIRVWKTSKHKLAKNGPEKVADKLVEDIKSGAFDKSVNKTLSKNAASEDLILPAIILGAIGVALLSVYFARNILYMFLYARVSIADWLNAQALYIRNTAYNNAKITEKQREEQENYAKRLETLAATIDVNLDEEDENMSQMIDKDRENLHREIIEENGRTEDSNVTDVKITERNASTAPIGLNF